MTVEEFAQAVCNEIIATTDHKVKPVKIMKANGVVCTNVAFEREGCLSASIRLNAAYNELGDDITDSDIEATADWVVKVYNKDREADPSNLRDKTAVNLVGSFDIDKIELGLLNTAANKELLDTIVHKDFLDLSIYASVVISRIDTTGGRGRAATKVNPAILEMWGMSEDEFWAQVLASNTEEKYRIQSMFELFMEMARAGYPVPPDASECDMYVASNHDRVCGAAVMTSKSTMKSFAEQIGGDFYIIPSSVHEVILLPILDDSREDEINQMIGQVNQEVLSPEEFLSNHVYRWSTERDQVIMADFAA